MTPTIHVRLDRRRGCGWRKEGGLYLVAAGLSVPCGKLPIPLDVCPTCHHGIKPTRGWTWINGFAFVRERDCVNALPGGRCVCPLDRLSDDTDRVGLLWIGEQFYPTPAHWIREADTQGISRRLSAVPKGFEVGKTWVFVAHRKAISLELGKHASGVFHVFKPLAIEYVVKPEDSDAKLTAFEQRGITLVRIERVEDSRELVM